MKRARTRVTAALGAIVLGATALVTFATAAEALSNPPIPVLTLDHTIPTSPFPSGPSASDIEGVGYVPSDNSLWVADDNGDRVYEINANTGEHKRTIDRPTFEAAGQVGTGTPAGFSRADDLESIIYDPAGDVLYVSSGDCCNSTVPAQPPYNPTMYKLTRVSGAFQVASWQALPEGQDPTAAGWRPGHGMYFGKGSKLKSYNYDTNTVGADISMPVTPIVGVNFVDASTAFITTSTAHTSSGATTAQSDATIRRYTISGSTWTLVPGWTFTLAGTGLIDARDLAIVGDVFYVTDGYDFRSSSDPLDHAIFVYNLGTAPPPTASFTAIPSVGRAPYTVQFTDTSVGTPPGIGDATSWAWDFTNDGSVDSTLRNPTFQYTAPGTFTAKLIASNATGPSTPATKQITVKAATNLPGGYELDGWGGIHPFGVGTGTKPAYTAGGGYWNGWDIACGIAVLPTGTGGYTIDGWGGLHPFRIGAGANPPAFSGNPYWVGWDIARGIAILPNGQGGYEVDGYGGIHPFSIGGNPMPPAIIGNPYWLGQDMARSITITPDGKGGYVTDRTGTMHPFKIGNSGVAPPATNGGYSNQLVSARGSAIIFDGTGGFTADGWGGLHGFGIGVNAPPPPGFGGPYWPGWDIVRGVAAMPDV